MADFIQLAITHYDARGVPQIGAREQLINLDQIESIEPHLGNNLFRRHSSGGRVPEEHYPCVQLTLTSGKQHLASFGVHPTAASGLAALEAFLPALTPVSSTLTTADVPFLADNPS